MTPGTIKLEVVVERFAWVREMVDAMRAIPTGSLEEFLSDPRNPAAAESYLRRALEALLDLGRHVLAKGFGQGVVEYKQIGESLARVGVVSAEHAALLVQMAGYRNRLTHFYNEVTHEELFAIVTARLGDIEVVVEAILEWLRTHPGKVDRGL